VSASLCAQPLIKFYDQVSGPDELPTLDSNGILLSTNMPFGQSFTPQRDQVGFLDLKLAVDLFGQPKPPTGQEVSEILALNLREGSITGPVVSSLTPVTITYVVGPGVLLDYEFAFPTPVSVQAGKLYVFELQHISGYNLVNPMVVFPGSGIGPEYYTGGDLIYRGMVIRKVDLWFREGVLIPEPCTVGLLVLGTAALVCSVRRGRSEAP
jgi:hypothetical protein